MFFVNPVAISCYLEQAQSVLVNKLTETIEKHTFCRFCEKTEKSIPKPN